MEIVGCLSHSRTLWREALWYKDNMTIDGASNVRLLKLLLKEERKKEQLRKQQ